MELLVGIWDYVIPFLIILTVLVFVHEMGHYLIARRNGVRVETFSIGFGPELFGWNDSVGTRWKFSVLPLGGYVKMFGEMDLDEGGEDKKSLTEEEKRVSFIHKRLGQRAAIVAAGPIANFLFAILAFAILFATVGQPYTAATIGSVQPDSAAEEAGLKAGDIVRRIDGATIDRFEDIKQTISLNTGTPLAVVVERAGEQIDVVVTPHMIEVTNRFGHVQRIARLGIRSAGVDFIRRGPGMALWEGAKETVAFTRLTLEAVGQMIVGTRTAEELSGPIGIAQMSGEAARGGMATMLWFMAILSINLGLINFFPIPLLDGGHLAFYAVEAALGRPPSVKAREIGFRLGLAFVLTLMVFATWNDLVRLPVADYVRGLFS
ncbi:MAG: RIP metalloprotease RseP [Alphaproteobacteria bacterium]|nr:RIP metalloprotease RseP [Alphaproteobacteria bacterium]